MALRQIPGAPEFAGKSRENEAVENLLLPVKKQVDVLAHAA
jgi:hypothetical protein